MARVLVTFTDTSQADYEDTCQVPLSNGTTKAAADLQAGDQVRELWATKTVNMVA